MDDLAGVCLPGADSLEYSVGSLDRKHVLASTVVYKLPFGPGQRFNPGNAIVSSIVGNWQLAGVFTANTGAPISVGGVCTGGGVIDASCYPELRLLGVSAKISGKAKHHRCGQSNEIYHRCRIRQPSRIYLWQRCPYRTVWAVCTNQHKHRRKRAPGVSGVGVCETQCAGGRLQRTQQAILCRSEFYLQHQCSKFQLQP